MALYTVDVYSGSSDSIIRDSHADGVIVKATQGTSYVNPRDLILSPVLLIIQPGHIHQALYPAVSIPHIRAS